MRVLAVDDNPLVCRNLVELLGHWGHQATSASSGEAALDALDREVARAGRQGHPLSLVVADVDRFHDYNARHGREAGDDLLAHLAEVFARCLRRQVDGAFRLGGDDFAMLLVECEAVEAAAVAKRVLGAVTRMDDTEAGLSLGVATLEEEDSSERLLYRAEAAAIRAASLGGDRVELAGPEDEPSPAADD